MSFINRFGVKNNQIHRRITLQASANVFNCKFVKLTPFGAALSDSFLSLIHSEHFCQNRINRTNQKKCVPRLKNHSNLKWKLEKLCDNLLTKVCKHCTM